MIELLIVIGIIGTLASITILAVNPNKQLIAANDATRNQNAKQLQSAILQYIVDKSALPYASIIGQTAATATNICNPSGFSSNCIRLDVLVPIYIPAIPVDAVEPCANFTGYKVYKNGPTYTIIPVDLGKKPGDSVTPDPNCTMSSLVSWLKADSINAANGSAVSAWADSSGNNKNLAQVTGANQPTFQTNVLNKKPVVRFDGVNDALYFTSSPPADPTVIVVSRRTGTNGGTLYNVFQGGGDWQYGGTIWDSGSAHWSWYLESGWRNGTIPVNTNWHITSFILQTNSAKIYDNGVIDLNYTPSGSLTVSNIDYIGAYGQITRFLVGDIAEVLVFNAALSDADRSNVETYLNNKYAIY